MYHIYFLLGRSGKVLYIGHSKDVEFRVSQHKQNIKFDSARWIACETKERALHYEKRLQNLFKPKYNKYGIDMIRSNKILHKLCIKPEILKRIKARADQEGRPVNNLIERILDLHV